MIWLSMVPPPDDEPLLWDATSSWIERRQPMRRGCDPLVRSTPVRNADVRWEDLDLERYHEKNYRVLREDDRQILTLLGRHFGSRPDLVPGEACGVDVGTGS